jgi:hypothetical protein
MPRKARQGKWPKPLTDAWKKLYRNCYVDEKGLVRLNLQDPSRKRQSKEQFREELLTSYLALVHDLRKEFVEDKPNIDRSTQVAHWLDRVAKELGVVWSPMPVFHQKPLASETLSKIEELRSKIHAEIAPQLPVADSLSDRKRDILQVLLQRGASDIDHRMTTEEIAEAVEGKGRSNPEAFKVPISDLKKANLIKTKEGRAGGVWLTEEGKKYAEGVLQRIGSLK